MHADPRIPRAALVTGGARRLGRAMAEALAADGFAVAIHYHASEAEAESLAEAIRARGGRAATLVADLADEDAVEALIARAEAEVGPLGCLVNNASIFEMDTAATATRASWDRHLEPNLRAPFVLAQRFAEALPEGTHGLVVNMLDQRVWNLTPYFMSYTLSKSGLWTLTRTLALALAPRVRVCGIGPGPTLPSPRQSDADFARQCRQTPLRHGPSPEEIALTLRFLLAAPSLTGQMIALDGGQHLGWAQESAAAPPSE